MRALSIAVLLLRLANPAEAEPRPAPRGDAVCETARSKTTIRAVERAGEILLDTGQVVQLAGLRVPEEDEVSGRALAWLRAFAGRPAVLLGRATADRWNRLPGRLAIETAGGSLLDLSEGLVEEGLALVDPGGADRLCHPELLALEATARERGLGLWGQERYKPVDADDVERLLGLLGSFVLVEGRVRSVGERRERTYLNFGTDWGNDLTVTISKRTWATMRDKGVTAESLKERRVRARGFVENRGGPALEITASDLLEMLDGGRARR